MPSISLFLFPNRLLHNSYGITQLYTQICCYDTINGGTTYLLCKTKTKMKHGPMRERCVFGDYFDQPRPVQTVGALIESDFTNGILDELANFLVAK